jgi:tetratricopeptide (TPR) repeat protein
MARSQRSAGTSHFASAIHHARKGFSASSVVVRISVVAALALVTAWNVTRSKSLSAAQAAAVKGDRADCLRHALEHLDHQPWSGEAALLAARSLSQLDFAEKAEPYYQRAGRLSLDDLQLRAYGLFRANKIDDAVRVYEEILERWPNNVTALRRLSAVQLARNDNDALMALADRLIRLPEGKAVGETLLGVVQHNNKNSEAAAAAFEAVLADDPKLQSMPLPRRMFWTFLANDLLSNGRNADACRYLARAVGEMADAGLVDFLGHAYELNGNLEEAEGCWRKALEMDPRTVAAILNLGKLAKQRKQYQQGLDYFLRAEELAPRNYEVAYQLALTYQLMGQSANAARYRKKAAELRDRPAHSGPKLPAGEFPSYAL